MIILIADEIDCLKTSSNQQLYSLFELPFLPYSKFILIGLLLLIYFYLILFLFLFIFLLFFIYFN